MFFKPPVDIEIQLDGEETRKHVDIANPVGSKTLKESYPLYEDGESISGNITLRVRDGKRVDHLGVKVSVIGSIDMVNGSSASNSGNSQSAFGASVDAKKKSVDQFLTLSYDLCPPGDLQHTKTFPFSFKDINKQYESYRGKNVDVTYAVKVTMIRKSADISKMKRLWVYLYNDLSKNIIEANGSNVNTAEEVNEQGKSKNDVVTKPVKLDIGIENCLHIEFEYSKCQFTLKDVIVGRIYFLLSRLKIKHMELSLIKRESSGLHTGNTLTDTTAVRYEIMDGSPVKGETIPIRLFLGGYNLTPTMSNNQFNVKNYLSLVIIDEDGRRYFKQSEIILYRTR